MPCIPALSTNYIKTRKENTVRSFSMEASSEHIENYRVQLQTSPRLSVLHPKPCISNAVLQSLFSIPLIPSSTVFRLVQRGDRIIHRLRKRKRLQLNVHLVNGYILAPSVLARCHVRSIRRRRLRGLGIGAGRGATATGAMHATAD